MVDIVGGKTRERERESGRDVCDVIRGSGSRRDFTRWDGLMALGFAYLYSVRIPFVTNDMLRRAEEVLEPGSGSGGGVGTRGPGIPRWVRKEHGRAL